MSHASYSNEGRDKTSCWVVSRSQVPDSIRQTLKTSFIYSIQDICHVGVGAFTQGGVFIAWTISVPISSYSATLCLVSITLSSAPSLRQSQVVLVSQDPIQRQSSELWEKNKPRELVSNATLLIEGPLISCLTYPLSLDGEVKPLTESPKLY